MKKIQLFGLCLLFAFSAQAQLGNILKKAKSKVESKIEGRADKAVDKKLDEMEGKKSEESTAGTTTTEAKPAQEARQTIKAYSRYDFVPGEKIIYAEDFSQEEIGELPLHWDARGKGMVVNLENQQGKWFRLYPGAKYLSGAKKPFGENYTLEFDLILDGTTPSGTRFFPTFNFGLFATPDSSSVEYSLFRDYMDKNIFEVSATPNVDAISKMELTSRENKRSFFDSEKQLLADFSTSFFKTAHYAIQVQKQRIRFWVNDIKVFDYPRAINVNTQLDRLFFKVADYWPYHDNNFGLYISNIKIAAGLPDSRHKLIEEGKFSTTGILFDVNSATIKASSYGVMKEIAGVLKENAAVKIQVVGHTSNDGDDAANLQLSTQRAAAVKELLVKDFGIEAARIETAGKGETQPVADNKTKEGKEQNRRVEFIKL